MKTLTQIIALVLMVALIACGTNRKPSNEGANDEKFAACMVNFIPYEGNPIVEGDHSSPILVFDGERYQLYTMHDKVWLYYNSFKK